MFIHLNIIATTIHLWWYHLVLIPTPNFTRNGWLGNRFAEREFELIVQYLKALYSNLILPCAGFQLFLAQISWWIYFAAWITRTIEICWHSELIKLTVKQASQNYKKKTIPYLWAGPTGRTGWGWVLEASISSNRNALVCGRWYTGFVWEII
jgi:hypothetical protein